VEIASFAISWQSSLGPKLVAARPKERGREGDQVYRGRPEGPSAIKAAAKRQGVELDGWKASVAIHLVSEWAETGIRLPDAVLGQAETLFKAIAGRFEQGISTGVADAP
jgi:hypothetical protein